MRSKGLGWLWGLAEQRKLDAVGGGGGGGTQAEGPVVRPAARAVFCMGRIRDEEEEGLGDVGFIQPPEMVERQLGVAFLMRSGSSCVGTVQSTFYYPKSSCSSLPCSSSVLL